MPRTNLSLPTASTAVSWDPDLPAPGGLCSIHQPKLFLRLTTLAEHLAGNDFELLDIYTIRDPGPEGPPRMMSVIFRAKKR